MLDYIYSLSPIIVLIIGLALLIYSGELLVKGAVSIAQKFKISTLVIGMTVVSFGTSAPELLVSIKAAFNGNPAIAMSNVIGSNIANIALVLAITVIIFPIIVDRNSKIIDWPMMMFSSLLFYAFAYDGIINSIEGAILFSLLIAFIVFIIRKSRKENKKTEESTASISEESMLKAIILLVLGLVGLKFGADFLLDGAVRIAQDFGMEEHVIGATIVAFGTSVPELVTSAIAAYRKQTDISIGNLIGSNIFNIMAVIGITTIIKPIEVDPIFLSFQMIWMLIIAVVLLPMMLQKKIGRLHGILLLLGYITFIIMCLKIKA